MPQRHTSDAAGGRTDLSLLALDAGQTGIKVRRGWADGTTEDDLLPGVLTDRPLAPQLSAAITRFADATGSSGYTAAIGLSGATDPHGEAARLLSEHPAAARVLVAHDSVSSYLGVLGDRPGAVVAAGTGVVTLGVGTERAARVDGWGNIMGDAGSGYWIGREALDAVMRAYDGRGPKTALTTVVTERWPDLESAYVSLQSDDERVRIVASFAAPTAALAAQGDQVAADICRRAADELALSVIAALRASGAPDDAVVSATGGVFGSAVVLDAFTASVRADRPDVRFVAPAGSGLDGVAALAELPTDHALRELIADADRANPDRTESSGERASR